MYNHAFAQTFNFDYIPKDIQGQPSEQPAADTAKPAVVVQEPAAKEQPQVVQDTVKVLDVKPIAAETFWTGKNIFRVAVLGLSVASLGAGVWQNMVLSSRIDRTKRLYKEQRKDDYKRSIKEVNSSENWRNGFYIGAGVLGVVCAVSLTF